MKISKEKLIQIIKEEHDMMQAGQTGVTDRVSRDAEGKMALKQLQHIGKYAIELYQILEPYGEELQLESWIQNKLTIAEDYVSKVKHYLENELNTANDLKSEE